MDERLREVQSLWESYGAEGEWNFITTGLKNGDLYFFTTLLKTFHATTAGGAKVNFIVDTEGKLRILHLAADYIDRAVFAPNLSKISNEAISEWCSQCGRDEFAPGHLIRLHPYLFSRKQFPIARTMNTNGALYFIELVKMSLRLPFRIAATPPKISEECKARAREEFLQLGLPVGKTLILFPYAQSLPFDTTANLEALAAAASMSGLCVCTAVHGAEKSISGTMPIKIQFDTLIPFAEMAGYVVAVRSGVGDMLSSARVQKVNLYNSAHLAFHDTPNSFGLGDCSSNYVVGPKTQPRQFAIEVLQAISAERYSVADHFLPPMVKKHFALTADTAHEVIYNDKVGVGIGRYWLFSNAVLADGWSSPEHWGVWSIGFRAILYLRVPECLRSNPSGALSIELDVQFSISKHHPSLGFEVEINGTLERFTANLDGRARILRFALSPSQRQVSYHRIIFDIANPASPLQQSGGTTTDDRLLGIGIKRSRYFAEW